MERAETVLREAAPRPGRAAGRPAAPRTVAARVRLGASPETAPQMLLELASDPAVTVRAAVAMNAATPDQVHDILAHDGDERVRTLLARKLATLIPTMSLPQRDALQRHALSMLSELVEDEALRVRAAIADVVADMPGVPRELILRLARDDDTAVFDPVIRLSPLLTSADLLSLLAAAPSPGRARSVARRAGIPEAVSDAVAATADTAAIGALLCNHSAAIREATLDALIARAGDVIEWHAPLVCRPALTARAARALSEIVATHLLDQLASRADLEPALTGELRRRLQDRLQREAPPVPEPTMEAAMLEAHELYAADGADEATLAAALQRGEARRATALLAVAADVGASVVDRAATLRSAKGLISLVWKAGFTMRVAGPLQALLARLGPDAILGPSSSGGFPLAIDEMRWQIDFLTRMGR